MKSKRFETATDALWDLRDGATLLLGGFGRAGVAYELIEAVVASGVQHLTIVNNNAGYDRTGVARLLEVGCVDRLICSFPWYKESHVFQTLYRQGALELEVVPQGTLAERLRAGGAGIGGFLTRTAVGTELAIGKELMTIDGNDFVFERPLRGDFALLRGHRIDVWGNVTYRKAARNFNPVMATAASVVVVEAAEEVPVGALDPEIIVTPGLFVDRYLVHQD